MSRRIPVIRTCLFQQGRAVMNPCCPVDTDPGVDDVLAILLALASPELEILAICASFGNTDVESSHRNVLKLFGAIERQIEAFPDSAKRFPNFNKDHKPLLLRGAEGPLEGKLLSAKYFHGRDGLSDITTRHPHLVPLTSKTDKQFDYLISPDDNGPQAILDILKSRPARSVTYCALGPLTTLSLTRRLSETQGTHFDDLIGRVLVMGGALDVPGNTAPVAEFNFVADPFAAEEVLSSTSLISSDLLQQMPLDITERHQLPFDVYMKRVDPELGSGGKGDKEPLIAFTSAFLEKTREIMLKFGMDWIQLHDPLVIFAALSNPPSGPLTSKWKVERRPYQVETLGKYTRGMCVVDRRGSLEAGTNRAEHGEIAEVQLTGQEGVQVVVETPGSEALVELMLERVWGR